MTGKYDAWIADGDPVLLECLTKLAQNSGFFPKPINTVKRLDEELANCDEKECKSLKFFLCGYHFSDGMSWTRLVRFRRKFPQVMCICMSGTMDSDLGVALIAEGIYAIAKPFRADQLFHALRSKELVSVT